MKYLLAAMCGIAAIFMGGCTLLAFQALPFALLPAAIAFLNLAIIGALFGWNLQWRPAFFILAGIDLVVALASASMAGGFLPADRPLVYALAAVFGAKGVLSLIYGLRTRAR